MTPNLCNDLFLDPLTQRTVALANALTNNDELFEGRCVREAAAQELLSMREQINENEDGMAHHNATMMTDGTLLEIAQQRIKALEAEIEALKSCAGSGCSPAQKATH